MKKRGEWGRKTHIPFDGAKVGFCYIVVALAVASEIQDSIVGFAVRRLAAQMLDIVSKTLPLRLCGFGVEFGISLVSSVNQAVVVFCLTTSIGGNMSE